MLLTGAGVSRGVSRALTESGRSEPALGGGGGGGGGQQAQDAGGQRNKASKAIHAVWRGFLTLVGAARAAPPFFRYLPPETQ